MKRLCVIGDPVGHSLSPLMHNAALEHLGLQKEFVFEKHKVSSVGLAEFVKLVRQKEFMGLAVTMPHKRSIIPLLDGISNEAKLAGAVNTVYWQNELLLGHNTDGVGCVNALEAAKATVNGKVIVVLGAGGAAGAIAMSLCLNNAKRLYILNRTLKKAKAIAEVARTVSGTDIYAMDLDLIEEALANANILINATSVGMKGSQKKTIVPMSSIKRDMTVMDLVYDPVQTPLINDAKRVRATTVLGTEMLLQQGALQFKLFAGKDAPIDAMRAAIKKKLGVMQ
jgi:shikimate dehydrogenase